jgi:excisionase family DNA binding protein
MSGSPTRKDQLETVAEAARRLAVSHMTVRRMIERGELTAVRVGPKLIRVRADELDALIRGSSGVRHEPRGA